MPVPGRYPVDESRSREEVVDGGDDVAAAGDGEGAVGYVWGGCVVSLMGQIRKLAGSRYVK